MEAAAITAGLARPTVLVGYGSFGLDVLQRTLVAAALRGVLRWREARGGGGAGERHLDELALVWVHAQDDAKAQTREGVATEVLRDLYREIREVPQSSRLEADVVAAIEHTARHVLSASGRAERPESSALGLDVVLVAHPENPETIGTLDRLMTAAMEHLANYPNLTSEVQGSERLGFLQILDFDNYWDRAEPAHKLRRAVRQSAEAWQRKRQTRRPAFSRIYLADGASTREGLRSLEHRLDEIGLWLELLLFEHPREESDPLRRLARSAGAHESPLGTFGVRLLERSAGLLSRLAAARFGIGWLDYLAEGSPLEPPAEARHLRDALAPYQVAELDRLLETETLRALLERDLGALENELLALAPEEPDWPAQVRARYERVALELQDRLAEATAERAALLARDQLAPLADALRAGVDADLRDPARPVAMAAVVAEIDRALDELGALGELEESPQVEIDRAFETLERLHTSYRRFNEDRIDLHRLKIWWWPLLALALTVALAPKAAEVAADLLPSAPWLTNPLTLGAVFFLGFWGLGAGVLQRLLTARTERARRFYKDAERGRFADRLRTELGPGGTLRSPIEAFFEALMRELRWGVRSEVRRELSRVRARLAERRREMGWLRGELREFLKLHGVTLEGEAHHLHRLGRAGSGIRHTIERSEDFAAVLAQNPPDPRRYRSLQASPERNPFGDWHASHAQAFLYPLAFIDELSKTYADLFLDELARRGSGPEQLARERELLGFFERHGSFDLAFGWKKQDGVPPGQRFAILPANWRRLPGVLPRLSELGVVSENVLTGADEARVYVLRFELGVEAEALEEPR